VDHCTVAEINHVYSPDGSLVFDQLIWWDWNASRQRFDVVDWRIIQNCRQSSDEEQGRWRLQYPDGPPYVGRFVRVHCVPCREGPLRVSRWYDEKTHRLRRVTADVLRETWSSYDREMVEREILPCNQRRGLKR
jgi:hypothetical protein